MISAAVFDLDGTLVAETSAERLLVPHLLRTGVMGWRQLGAAFGKVLTLPVAGRTSALRRNKRWLSGLDREVVVDSTLPFVAEVLARHWCGAALARLEEMRRAGHAVHLLTGAPDFIAEAVADHLEMDGWLATPLEVVDGHYTGRLAGPHLFADAKRTAVEELARRRGIDLGRSYGFADHGTDVPFLECFGHPVAVQPKTALRRVAERRSWEILEGC